MGVVAIQRELLVHVRRIVHLQKIPAHHCVMSNSFVVLVLLVMPTIVKPAGLLEVKDNQEAVHLHGTVAGSSVLVLVDINVRQGAVPTVATQTVVKVVHALMSLVVLVGDALIPTLIGRFWLLLPMAE